MRRGSLYILQPTIVMDSAAVTSSLTNVDLTPLWHAQLGHMSEKDTTILSKRGLLGSECTGKFDFCDPCVFGKQKRVSFFTA